MSAILSDSGIAGNLSIRWKGSRPELACDLPSGYDGDVELRSLTEYLDRVPFEPFVIELSNGRRVTIRHPENVLFFPSRVKLWHVEAYDEEEDVGIAFSPSAVTCLAHARGNGDDPA